MIRDGSEGHQRERLTAYATPAENLRLLPAQAGGPSAATAASTELAYTFTGSMSLARLEDWVEYVEGNLLREYLISFFPDCVRDWDIGIALGRDPRTPLRTDQGEPSPVIQAFNHLIIQGPVRTREPSLGHLGNHSWAAAVVQDIRHCHAQGYRANGLVQAISTYVACRNYGGHASWAHRQLHTAWAFVSELPNATAAVPPPGFNVWAARREQSLWTQCQNSATPNYRHARAPYVLPHLDQEKGMVPCHGRGWGRGAASWRCGSTGAPPTVAQVSIMLQRRDVAGSDLMGLLHQAITSREVAAYSNFAQPLVQILSVLADMREQQHHPIRVW